MKRSVVLAAMMTLTAACAGTPSGASTASLSPSSSVSSTVASAGGVALLWGKISATWKVVAIGQNPPMCADIRTAGWTSTIPKDFFGGQCYEKGSQTLVDYKP